MKEKKPKFNILSFNEAYEPPANKVNVRQGFVEWGEDNQYPLRTFEMYNYTGSSTHKSIINKKSSLIAGNGIKTITDPALNKFIEKNDVEDLLKKITLDYECINGWAIEVVWSNDGQTIASMQHFPIQKLRKGIESEEIPYPHFLYSDDWSQYKKADYRPVPIREYNPYIKQGKQIFVYYEYNPQVECYPIEQYSSCMNWIEMDYEISRFHLNQIKQGYHPSFILNFATGIPTDEEIYEFERDFEYKFKGSKNSGNFFLTYSDSFDQRPEFTPIQLNDSDERFAMLIEQSEIQISRGHEIPPQMVILTPGKLSSTDEREELLREFQDTYVDQRQNNIESAFNGLLKDSGFNEGIEFKTYGVEEGSEDVPVESDKEADARAQLRGSVGGVQGIIQIQESVAAGTSDKASAQALLELVYGFSPEEAR